MIPKKIHYCWFGNNSLPESAQNCIDSWRKFLPDHEIVEWNERNFDVNIIPYTAEAYSMKKYAFVSDYARFWILFHFGGLYFDTDVEIIAPMDHIISQGAFMGQQTPGKSVFEHLRYGIAAGLGLGAEQNHPFYKEILEKYKYLHFIRKNGTIDQTNVVNIVTKMLLPKAFEKSCDGICKIEGITIYPPEYFCPKDFWTGEMLNLTENSVSIHHYTASWKGPVPQKGRLSRTCERLTLMFIRTRAVILYYLKRYVAR